MNLHRVAEEDDYLVLDSHILIDSNITESKINLTLFDDSIPEIDEVFFVEITKVVLLSDTPQGYIIFF